MNLGESKDPITAYAILAAFMCSKIQMLAGEAAANEYRREWYRITELPDSNREELEKLKASFEMIKSDIKALKERNQ